MLARGLALHGILSKVGTAPLHPKRSTAPYQNPKRTQDLVTRAAGSVIC